jgi:hypothetical protein
LSLWFQFAVLTIWHGKYHINIHQLEMWNYEVYLKLIATWYMYFLACILKNKFNRILIIWCFFSRYKSYSLRVLPANIFFSSWELKFLGLLSWHDWLAVTLFIPETNQNSCL